MIFLRTCSGLFPKITSTFSIIINPFDKYYDTRVPRHVIITVDISTIEKPWHDMILIILSVIPNPEKSRNFVSIFVCHKHIIYVVLLPDNQYRWNHKCMNKL